jgi:hypothetical protein
MQETTSLRKVQGRPSLEQVTVGQLARKRTLGAELGQSLPFLVELALANLDSLDKLLLSEQ